MENTEENIEYTEEVENTEELQGTEEVQYTNEEIEKLNEIHNDLGIIVCFLVFFTIVIILKFVYRFFNMIFQF